MSQHAPRAHHAHHNALHAWPTKDGKHRTAAELHKEFKSDQAAIDAYIEVLLQGIPGDRKRKEKEAELYDHLVLFCSDSEEEFRRRTDREIPMAYEEFRRLVRIYHAISGHYPTAREYMTNSTVEGAVSVIAALTSMQVACLAATMAEDAEFVLPPLAAAGGAIAVTAAALLDSAFAQPVLHSNERMLDTQPADLHTRRAYFLAASCGTGVLLSPAVPLISAFIGDKESKGYGPMALAGLAGVICAGQVALIQLQNESSCAAHLGRANPTAVVGAASAAAVCVGVAKLAGREGSIKPLLMGSALITGFSVLTAQSAQRGYWRGEPEPLRPTFAPILRISALAVNLAQFKFNFGLFRQAKPKKR